MVLEGAGRGRWCRRCSRSSTDGEPSRRSSRASGRRRAGDPERRSSVSRSTSCSRRAALDRHGALRRGGVLVAPADAAQRSRGAELGVVGDGDSRRRSRPRSRSGEVGRADRWDWDEVRVPLDLVVVAPSPGSCRASSRGTSSPSSGHAGCRCCRQRAVRDRRATFVPARPAAGHCFHPAARGDARVPARACGARGDAGALPVPAGDDAAVGSLAAFLALRWAVGGDFHLAGAFYALEPVPALARPTPRLPRTAVPGLLGLDGAVARRRLVLAAAARRVPGDDLVRLRRSSRRTPASPTVADYARPGRRSRRHGRLPARDGGPTSAHRSSTTPARRDHDDAASRQRSARRRSATPRHSCPSRDSCEASAAELGPTAVGPSRFALSTSASTRSRGSRSCRFGPCAAPGSTGSTCRRRLVYSPPSSCSSSRPRRSAVTVPTSNGLACGSSPTTAALPRYSRSSSGTRSCSWSNRLSLPLTRLATRTLRRSLGTLTSRRRVSITPQSTSSIPRACRRARRRPRPRRARRARLGAAARPGSRRLVQGARGGVRGPALGQGQRLRAPDGRADLGGVRSFDEHIRWYATPDRAQQGGVPQRLGESDGRSRTSPDRGRRLRDATRLGRPRRRRDRREPPTPSTSRPPTWPRRALGRPRRRAGVLPARRRARRAGLAAAPVRGAGRPGTPRRASRPLED